LQQQNAEIVVRQREFGIQLQRGGIMFDGVVEPALRVVNAREVVVRHGRIGVERQRGLIMRDGFRVFLLLAEDDAQKCASVPASV